MLRHPAHPVHAGAKLEEELNVQLFDRNKKPVAPTPIGRKIVAQAAIAVGESMRIKDIIDQEKGSVSGGILPGNHSFGDAGAVTYFPENLYEKIPQSDASPGRNADIRYAVRHPGAWVIDAGIACYAAGRPGHRGGAFIPGTDGGFRGKGIAAIRQKEDRSGGFGRRTTAPAGKRALFPQQRTQPVQRGA